MLNSFIYLKVFLAICVLFIWAGFVSAFFTDRNSAFEGFIVFFPGDQYLPAQLITLTASTLAAIAAVKFLWEFYKANF